ncbi:MAG: ATP-dependent RNA helicase HrpA [Gammaproteobacteria bacterium]
MNGPTAADLDALRAAIGAAMLADRPVLERRLRDLRRSHPTPAAVERLRRSIDASAARVAQRRALAWTYDYPDELPVSRVRERIAAGIAAHPVVVVCGATGSGKSTQLPKLCAQMGRGILGTIGHTQPRRIAARTIAARVAEELHTGLGGPVGYKVRFDDRTGPDTRIKLMTDGILLEELRADRNLLAYDTLIVDEAHERTLNIDLVLGLLQRLLPRRPELRLIVTSATIDPDRFSRFFGAAPIIDVEGRGHPVELRWAPPPDQEADADLPARVAAAAAALAAECDGDVLAFLPTERDIRDSAGRLAGMGLRAMEVVPLYSRLDLAAQRRVFGAHAGRRIVLATNVAETAVTVPGIRAVVDSGLARISRYSARTKIERLPIEPISRAAADQRLGRCGRLGPGICVRLYAREDYLARPEFTEPEILRSNLAAVILRLRSLGWSAVEHFPFLDPPELRDVNAGYRLLWELGAIDAERRLTPMGRTLAALPLDPRIGRILVAGRDMGCLEEMLVIAAALAVPDPRERPIDRQAQADACHARFADASSDFLWFVNLWAALREQGAGNAALRRMARAHFLSFQRLREWRDTLEQFSELAADRRWPRNAAPASYAQIHRALLAGFVAQVAVREPDGSYTGARGLKAHLFPGSGLAARPPPWILAAEVTQTSRVFARTAARINPRWIAHAAAHLVNRSLYEPRWDRRTGRVLALERLQLYGLTVAAGRRVELAVHDPLAAREIFLREGVVASAIDTALDFRRVNDASFERLRALEQRARRHDLVIGEQQLYELYAERIPAQICSQRALEGWASSEPQAAARLQLSEEELRRPGSEAVRAADYPDGIEVDGLHFALRYRFEPGSADDGITAIVPLAVLNQLRQAPFDWLVPGWLPARIDASIRGLPKDVRRALQPIGERIATCIAALAAAPRTDLDAALSEVLLHEFGVAVSRQDWEAVVLPAHLRMHLEIVDAQGRTIAAGDDVDALRAQLGAQARERFSNGGGWPIECHGARAWIFGSVDEVVEGSVAGHRVRGFPALVDEHTGVGLKVWDTRDGARAQTRAGLRRLARLALPDQVKFLRSRLRGFDEMSLMFAGVGSGEQLREDLLDAVLDRACELDPDAIRDPDTFAARVQAGRARLSEAADRLCAAIAPILRAWREVRSRLPQAGAAAVDLGSQLDALVYPGFIAATPPPRLLELPRYLRAARMRLDKLRLAPARDAAQQAALQPLWDALRAHPHWRAPPEPPWERFRWQLEELRVSLFAQELGTVEPVSVPRLQRALDALH